MTIDYRKQAAELFAAARAALDGTGYDDPAELAVVGILGCLLSAVADVDILEEDDAPRPARAAEADPLEFDDADTIEQPAYRGDVPLADWLSRHGHLQNLRPPAAPPTPPLSLSEG